MSTAIPPMPAEAAPRLSEPARVINTFVAPSKTFEDIRQNASWWLPWLLGVAAAVGFFYTVDKKVGFDTIVASEMEHAPQFLQNIMDQMKPEQRQQMIDRQIKSRRISTLYFSWAIYLIIAMIAAALFMVTFNFGLEAGIPYKKALAVYFYAMLPKILWYLLAIIVLYKGVDSAGFYLENPVATNIGAFLDRWNTNRLLYHFASFIDIFTIWSIILLAMGFQRQATKKISTGAAVTAVACVYVLGILIRSALPG